MKAKVENRNFTAELKNKSSQAFQDFEKKFKQQMDELYQNIKGYRGVEIHSLSNGSIVVNYTVLLEVPATTLVNSTVRSISEELVTAINSYNNCCQSNSSCSFCFNSNFTNVTSYKTDDVNTDLCIGQVPEAFQEYYSPAVTKVGVLCVTRCDKRSADPYTCTYGTCVVKHRGPLCECSDKAAFWYLDNACASRISKVGVAVGVPVAVLTVVAAVFTIFLLRAQRENLEYREKLSSRSELYDDDENWSSSQGFTTSNQAANWEGSETPNVCVSLENVDTSQALHIQRPSSIIP
ncbi:mucin-3A-like [Struthio camelus]|uniref:mucin-3A-like n=1 Tax=Struthio camelus TaxID=8801 RepID=UPI0036041C35